MKYPILVLWLSLGVVSGQNLAPNPSFEQGTTSPTGWTKSSGTLAWENFGHTGTRSVSVGSVGGCGTEWRSSSFEVQPGRPYVLRFWGISPAGTLRRSSAALGYIAGRYIELQTSWAPYAFVAVTPETATNANVRVGQCFSFGTLVFDDIEVRPASPVHSILSIGPLGSGEAFRAGHYSFVTALGSFSGGYARPLVGHTASFDHDCWTMSSNSVVTYKHSFDGLQFTNASLKATMTYCQSGSLIMEVSTNAQNWVEAGSATPANYGTYTTYLEFGVPQDLLPASALFVRLHATGSLKVSKYSLDGDLPGGPSLADGNTLFLEQASGDATVNATGMYDSPTGYVLQVQIQNPNSEIRRLAANLESSGAAGTRTNAWGFEIAPYTTNLVNLPLPTAGVGDNAVSVQLVDSISGATVLGGSLTVSVAAIRDSSFGHPLTSPSECAVWWCEGTYKVSRERIPPLEEPSNPVAPIQIAAARNEYEPFQLVLRSKTDVAQVQCTVSDFTSTNSFGVSTIPSTNIESFLVEYVPVTEPSDYSGATGDHPDPLVPLGGAFELVAERNQPLWFNLYVPKGATPGDYYGTVTIQSDSFSARVPVSLHVRHFAISDVTHTRTSYKVNVNTYWHGLTNRTQEKEVWELYMQNFRKHRVSPFAPHTYAPVDWSFYSLQFYFNYAEFDKAMERYIDEFGFNGFNVMDLPKTLPWYYGWYSPFSLEYRYYLARIMQPIMDHVREKGWEDQAYCFWFDEPAQSAYSYVSEGLNVIRDAAPGLNRLLTHYPDSTFYGEVDTWVPLYSAVEYFNDRCDARLGAGDDIWWYVCTGPDAPNPNNFIDHAALNQRIRPWIAERFGLTGELYWNTTYYIGKDGVAGNPWENAMCVAYPGWSMGNGDGVLLYPPTKTPPAEPVISGPFNSIRWELTREGLEDAEYFWLLKQAIFRTLRKSGVSHPGIAQAYAARQRVLDLAPTSKTFNRDPQELYAAREQVAQAIEALDNGAPFFVRQPKAKAAKPGGKVVFRAEALGIPEPDYQWLADGTEISGQTNSSLELAISAGTPSAVYTVRAANPAGRATSSPVLLAVVDPAVTNLPVILAQPENQFGNIGEDSVFTVTAVSSEPLSYQWFKGETPLIDATNSFLSLTNVTEDMLGAYSVSVSNSCGLVRSDPASLDLATATFISARMDPYGAGIRLEYWSQGADTTVMVSTNLVDWSELISVPPTKGKITILDDSAKGVEPRFYRVRVN